MEISKKDLLKVTGISYGQLYRWKREGLIPEEWFDKRASFTGQETFFPKELIMKRIEMIQQLKDHYSLEEMAKMLTPNVQNRLFNEDDIETFKEISTDVATCFMDVLEKDEFRFSEIVLMIALSKCLQEEKLTSKQLEQVVVHGKHIIEDEHIASMILQIIQIQDIYAIITRQENSKMDMDARMVVVYEQHLQELSSTIKLKYQHVFQFDFID